MTDINKNSIKSPVGDFERQSFDWDADTSVRAIKADYPESGYEGYTLGAIGTRDWNSTTNPLYHIGWNIDPEGYRYDTNDAGLAWRFEARYDNSVQLNSELMALLRRLDGTQARPFFVRYRQSEDKYETMIRSDKFIKLQFDSPEYGLTDAVDIFRTSGGLDIQKRRSEYFRWTDPNDNTHLLLDPGNVLKSSVPIYVDFNNAPILESDDSSGTRKTVAKITSGDDLEVGDGSLPVSSKSAGEKMAQRGAPTTSELASGEVMRYVSDGTDAGAAGDLMYAINDAGTIKTNVIAAKANAT